MENRGLFLTLTAALIAFISCADECTLVPEVIEISRSQNGTFEIEVSGIEDLEAFSTAQWESCHLLESHRCGGKFRCPLTLQPWRGLLLRGTHHGETVTFSLPHPDYFIFGVVVEPFFQQRDPSTEIIPAVDELGADCVKFWVPWRSAVKSVTSPFNWEETDRIIHEFLNAGLCVIPLILDATTAPMTCESEDCAICAPEEPGFRETLCNEVGCVTYEGIGRQRYIELAVQYAKEFALRYRDRIFIYNIENELNWACTHSTVAKWRVGYAWCNDDFKAELLSSVANAIREVHPGAYVSMNFNVHDPATLLRIRKYSSHLTLLGIGAYPNYLFPEPVLGEFLGEWVDILKGASGLPVMVLETGYPSGPTSEGYSEILQAEFVRQSLSSSIQEGAAGYVYLKLRDPDLPFEGIKRVENFWGLMDSQGNKKQSFYAYQEIINRFR